MTDVQRKEIVENLIASLPAKTEPVSLSQMLTPRETEITRLAAVGLTNKEIGQALDISHWTVATHLRRIFDKAQVKRRAALSLVLLAQDDI